MKNNIKNSRNDHLNRAIIVPDQTRQDTEIAKTLREELKRKR